MEKKVKIFAFAGSLRKGSYNQGLLHTALEVLPSNVHLEVFSLQNIPLYNQDDEKKLPSTVVEFKKKAFAADAILIATPEYNYSVPGVLKNALDWGSRPYGESCWENKPVAIMGASMGLQGTARAQYHLRQIFVGLNMRALNRPELMISQAQNKFDANGLLKDPAIRQKIGELLAALAAAVSL
jgi:chromate reductase